MTVDPRDEFIGRVVPGKSFADVGGLWGTVNEKVSVAHAHGASSLAMVDVASPGDERWAAFEQRRQELSLPATECLSGDVARVAEETGALYDIVHCSYVLLHVPSPVEFLVGLRRMTREHLVLTTVVSPERTETEVGVLELPKAAALFVPALDAREQKIARSYWRCVVGDTAVGLTVNGALWDPTDFGAWWWLMTPQVVEAMCSAAGFECVEAVPTWDGHARTYLLASRGSPADSYLGGALRALREERERLAAAVQRLEQDLNRVHESRSWRVTRPLRAATGTLRRSGAPREDG